jgi:Tol biopolymer transport system component
MKPKELRKLKLGKPSRVTKGLTGHEHPAVSPDGEWLAYYHGEYGSIGIVVCDLRGRLARRVSPHGGNNTQPAWHPGSLKVAFRHQHTVESKWELWECDLIGGQPRVLLSDSRWDYKHPSYSPDGQLIAYFSDEGSAGNFHLWLLEPATGQRRQLTHTPEQNHCHPVFSPDGERLVFHAYEYAQERREPPVTNIYELELDSGDVTALTSGEDQYKHPFYLDNDVITFHHERNSDGVRGLKALHLKTGGMVELTDGSNNDKHPFPFIDRKGRMKLAFSSKKLGGEEEGEDHSYDIFIARLKT